MSQLSPYPSEVFDSWAEVYDTQPNPLLSLEQRILAAGWGIFAAWIFLMPVAVQAGGYTNWPIAAPEV